MTVIWSLPRILEHGYDKLLVALGCVVLIVVAGPLLSRLSHPPRAPSLLRQLLPFGSPRFHKNRAAFLAQGRERTLNRQFSFWYGPHHVVAISGTSGRTGYLTSRGLDSIAGFQVLLGNFLNIDELSNTVARTARLVYKRCTQDDHLTLNLHHLVNDSAEFTQQFGKSAVLDPVDKVGHVVYRLTHRLNGAHDIANSPALVSKTRELYKALEESSVFDIWFPLLPTPAKLKKLLTYSKLYWTILGFVSERRKSGRVENDALQLIMEQKVSNSIIALAIIGAVVPAILNSSISAAWNICFLIQHPDWMERLKSEIDAVVETHKRAPNESMKDVLSRLTLEDWETKFPTFELSLRETLRFVMAGTVVRKNVSGKEIPIGDSGSFIPPNSLAVYGSADAHMNPAIYKDPHVWDPSRHAEGRAEGKDVPHAYLGWGSGNHPCPAMRMAKLTLLVPTIMLLATFDAVLCDAQGRTIQSPLPPLTYDRIGAARPSKQVFIKVQAREPTSKLKL